MNEPDETKQSPGSSAQFDIDQFIETAKSVVATPAAYFKSMPTSGGLKEPLIFLIAMSLAAGLVSAILSFVGSPVGMLAFGFAAIILVPISAMIGGFIGAGILYVIWKLMGSERDYEVSFRCVAAISAIYPITALFYLVPYIGTIASLGWGTFLLIEASVAVHGRERRSAQLVFGIIAAILVLMNLSAEHTARKLAADAEGLQEVLRQYNASE